MADHSQHLAIIVTAQDLASGKFSKVRSELAGMGTAGRIASVGLGGAMVVAGKTEQAFGHLKNRLTSLAGPLGFIGLSGAVFSLGGAFEQGISKAQAMGLAVEQLTGVTGMSAHVASQMIAVFGKYGLSEQQIGTMAGIAEKKLGTLNVTNAVLLKSTALVTLENEKLSIQLAGGSTKAIDLAIAHQKASDALNAHAVGMTKLEQLDRMYGLSLVDSKGKVVDFATEINQLADMYTNKSIPADQRAAVASQLLGRQYMAMIPILKLGSAGIAAAAAEADRLGLTLKTAQDVTNVNDFIAAERNAKDAIGGLEVQLGLLVMPDLTAGLTAFTSFMATHQDEVKAFFAQGLSVAEGLATFITGTLVPTIGGLASGAAAMWNTIPAPIRDLLTKAIVGDRIIHFLFGVSPIHAVVSLAEGALAKGLGGAFGGFLQKGSIANPMFVKDVTGGLPNLAGGAGGAAEGAAAGVGELGGVATVAALAAPVAIAVAAIVGTDALRHALLTPQQIAADDAISRRVGAAARGRGSGGGNVIAGTPDLLGGGATPSGLIAVTDPKVEANTEALARMAYEHIGLVKEFTRGGGATTRSAAGKGLPALDKSFTDLVSLFSTSLAPSAQSEAENMALLVQATREHPTDTVLHGDLVTLQALVAQTTNAINNKQFFVPGGNVGTTAGTTKGGIAFVQGLQNHREGSGVSVTVPVSVIVNTSARANEYASVQQGRYGPTRAISR